jgi:ribose transport system ATP-binding protein
VVTGNEQVFRVKDVRKTFAGTTALAGVSFDLGRGSIHALLGGNGSGKSTVIKVMAGVYQADAGRLEAGAEALDAAAMTPAKAKALGLRFVHQQQSTFPELSVTENLAIGHGFGRGALTRVPWRSAHRQTQATLERFQINASPRDRLGDLGPATQAMVAIARALQDQEGEGQGVLVLDEPTASLPASEVEMLLDALQRYAARGQTILYVTHRLDEVLRIADCATIFRDGVVAATLQKGELSHENIVEKIMGRRVERMLEEVKEVKEPATGGAMLRVQELAAGPVQDASFELREGEILGIAGLLGSGRSTILRSLFGMVPREGGTIELCGQPLEASQPREAMAAGVAYVPEDRLADAAFAELSVLDNIGITACGSYFRAGRLRRRAERRDAEELIRSFQVKTASLDAPFTSMSGGNQQKVVLARWMRRDPKLLLLDEPTQGVDVGARAEIWQLVRRAVDAGAGALVVSSDYEELSRVCDRVLVLRQGRIATDLQGDDLSEENLDHLTWSLEAAR